MNPTVAYFLSCLLGVALVLGPVALLTFIIAACQASAARERVAERAWAAYNTERQS